MRDRRRRRTDIVRVFLSFFLREGGTATPRGRDGRIFYQLSALIEDAGSINPSSGLTSLVDASRRAVSRDAHGPDIGKLVNGERRPRAKSPACFQISDIIISLRFFHGEGKEESRDVLGEEARGEGDPRCASSFEKRARVSFPFLLLLPLKIAPPR